MTRFPYTYFFEKLKAQNFPKHVIARLFQRNLMARIIFLTFDFKANKNLSQGRFYGVHYMVHDMDRNQNCKQNLLWRKSAENLWFFINFQL